MTEAEKRKHRVCFTGHRPEKLTRHECQVIRDLEAAIKKAIADGYNVFISGMAPGVDIWAAEIVLQLRDEGADIKLICAIPFEGFEKRWPEWEGRYNAIMEKADLVRFISADDPAEGSDPAAEPTEEAAKTLVVYFSATGNTKAVAEEIVRLTGADLHEIVPADPYTAEDLNYNNNNDCRANQEMNDASARPAIGSEAIDVSSYDTVFVGYPIWWGTMPRIINAFLDTYDLSGKTVLPFCTSGGSGISQSVSAIRAAEPDPDVRDGLRSSGADDSGIEGWIADNGIGQ